MTSVIIRSGPVYSYVNVGAVGFDPKIARVLLGLDNALAVDAPGTIFYRRKHPTSVWDGKHHFFNKGTGRFPTGLMTAVLNYLRSQHVGHTIKPMKLEEKILCEGVELNNITLRDYQVQAIVRALEKRRGILFCATNAGKTDIAIAIFVEINNVNDAEGILITHRKEIFQQTVERFKERTGIEPATIAEGGIKNPDSPFIVAMVKSLYNILTHKKPSAELKAIASKFHRCGVMFLDECHLAPADTWYTVAQKCEAPFRYGLSGTPFSEDDRVRNAKLEAMTGPTIYKVTNKFLIENKFSAKPFILVDDSLAPCKSTSIYAEDYGCYVVYNHDRNRKIIEYCDKAIRDNRKSLVIVRHIDHGNIIYNNLKMKMPGNRSEFIHGETRPETRQNVLKQFKEGKVDVLVSSMILKEGVDIDNISCLIMAYGGEADSDVLQVIGRALRKKKGGDQSTVVVDFSDPYGKYLKKHARKRQATYKKEGFVIVNSWDELQKTIRKDSTHHECRNA